MFSIQLLFGHTVEVPKSPVFQIFIKRLVPQNSHFINFIKLIISEIKFTRRLLWGTLPTGGYGLANFASDNRFSALPKQRIENETQNEKN